MTTPLVPSITDEQIAEIEAAAKSIRGWSMKSCFQEVEEGFGPDDWEWYVGALDEEGNQYPLLHVNAHQYDSGDSELLAKYYAMVNRDAVLALISRLRAAERDAERWEIMAQTVVADCNGTPKTEAQQRVYNSLNSVISVASVDELNALFDAAMQEHNQ